MEIEVIDLTEEWDSTFALLDDTRAWRERSVYEIVLGDGDSVNTTTAYQVRIPLDLVRRFQPQAESGDWVRLLLPFAVRSKELLFKVDFKGVRDHPVVLLRRQEIAELQARYLARLAPDAPASLPSLWEGLSAFTTTAWHHHIATTKPRVWHRVRRGYKESWRKRALAAYLSNGLGLNIKPGHVTKWLNETEQARKALVEALGEGEYPDSSSECILLAIPFMSYRPESIKAIDILIGQFREAVDAMSQDALQVLAEYGRRWEAIVETTVPIGRSCTIKLTEKRPWIETPSPVLEQVLPFGDALSTHIETRSTDPDVEIKRLDVTDLEGKSLGIEGGDAKREAADAAAFYASSDERPYVARVRVKARLRRWRYLLNVWLVVMTGVASLVALSLPQDADLVDSLTLLTLPLTLAAAFILTRVSPLAERILRRWRTSLMVAVSLLWAVALLRLWEYAGIELGKMSWLCHTTSLCF